MYIVNCNLTKYTSIPQTYGYKTVTCYTGIPGIPAIPGIPGIID